MGLSIVFADKLGLSLAKTHTGNSAETNPFTGGRKRVRSMR